VEFELPGNSELARLGCAKLEDFAGQSGLPGAVIFAADHALAEHLQNIADHARSPTVTIEFSVIGETLTIRIIDHGAPFDPTQAPDPDFTVPMDRRPVGGLGVHMVRKLMDQVCYTRRDGCNELVMTKRFERSAK
jgi:serine/threonine-protein kinase RsbW